MDRTYSAADYKCKSGNGISTLTDFSPSTTCFYATAIKYLQFTQSV